jgi:hypothetical protein
MPCNAHLTCTGATFSSSGRLPVATLPLLTMGPVNSRTVLLCLVASLSLACEETCMRPQLPHATQQSMHAKFAMTAHVTCKLCLTASLVLLGEDTCILQVTFSLGFQRFRRSIWWLPSAWQVKGHVQCMCCVYCDF